MTLENWNQLMYLGLKSKTNKFFTMAYFIIWIFIGNYVLLNLFLAILLNGFGQNIDKKEEMFDGLQDDEEEPDFEDIIK